MQFKSIGLCVDLVESEEDRRACWRLLVIHWKGRGVIDFHRLSPRQNTHGFIYSKNISTRNDVKYEKKVLIQAIHQHINKIRFKMSMSVFTRLSVFSRMYPTMVPQAIYHHFFNHQRMVNLICISSNVQCWASPLATWLECWTPEPGVAG